MIVMDTDVMAVNPLKSMISLKMATVFICGAEGRPTGIVKKDIINAARSRKQLIRVKKLPLVMN